MYLSLRKPQVYNIRASIVRFQMFESSKHSISGSCWLHMPQTQQSPTGEWLLCNNSYEHVMLPNETQNDTRHSNCNPGCKNDCECEQLKYCHELALQFDENFFQVLITLLTFMSLVVSSHTSLNAFLNSPPGAMPSSLVR